MKLSIAAAFGSLVLLGAVCCGPVAAQTGYHVLKTIPVAGDGGWDYINVEPSMNHLFISRGTHVIVWDTSTGGIVGDIPNTAGVHGIAIAEDLGKGFTSNGRAASVSIFNLRTLEPITTVQVDEGPDGICYDPATKRVFTFNGRSDDASAVDAVNDKLVGNIPLDGRPEFPAADGRGHVYCNIEDKSEITQIDAKTLKVLNVWPLAPGEGPSGLSIDAKHHRLFSVCHNQKMVVMDSDTGKIIATPTIGDGPDASWFDPGTGYAFSSNGGSGTLTIVQEKDPNTFVVADNVPTQQGARTMAVDTKAHRVYLVTAKFGPPDPNATGWGRRRGTMIPGSFVVVEVGR